MTAQAFGHRHAIGEAEVGALVPGLWQGHRGNTGLKGELGGPTLLSSKSVDVLIFLKCLL